MLISVVWIYLLYSRDGKMQIRVVVIH